MKKKILLVDDDPGVLEMIGDFLEGEGYEVLRSPSGEDALARLRAGAQPALVILDMMMPGIGGMGVLERLARPDGSFRYPLLVLTAKSSMAEYFADKKVDGFLAKPCEPEDLAAEVSRIVFQSAGGGAPMAVAGRKAVYLADPSQPRRAMLVAALEDAGYAAMDFADAPSLVQEAVTRPPAAVAAAVALEGVGAVALATLLKGMPATAATRMFVYGIGEAGAALDAVVSLDPRLCTAIPGSDADALIAALDAAIG